MWRALPFLTAVLVWHPSMLSAEITWKKHDFRIGEPVQGITVADVNEDGRPDLLATGPGGYLLLAPDFEPQLIFDSDGQRFIHASTLDADGDGDLDFVLGSFHNPWGYHAKRLAEGKESEPPSGPAMTVVWLENTGDMTKWPVHVLEGESNQCHGTFVADLNGDGAEDVLANSVGGQVAWNDSLMWYPGPFAPGDEPGAKRQVASKGEAKGRSHYFDVADLDGDGTLEVLLTAPSAGELNLWRPGQDPTQPWEKETIFKRPGITQVAHADVDGDGTLDLFIGSGHGETIGWLKGPDWTEQVIDPDITHVHALTTGDFNSDGFPDVAGISYEQKQAFWYENDGKGNFTRHAIVPDAPQEAYDLRAVDMDGDDRLDLVVAGRGNRNVVWYQNLGE